MTALEQLTAIQAAALQATADHHLRDPEELAAEWLPLLLIEPDEYDAQEDADEAAAVKAYLTPTADLPRPFVVSINPVPDAFLEPTP